MYCFIKDMTVEIDNNIFNSFTNSLEKFLKELSKPGQSLDHYTKNRNAKPGKVRKDNYYGKYGELITSVGLSKFFNLSLPLPDFEIRRGKNKGWNIDINNNDIAIHVKTCPGTTYKNYGDYSWVFQNEDVIFKSGGKELCSLVYVEDIKLNYGIIKAVLPFNIICQYLKPMIRSEHKESKVAVYYEDLLKDKDKILEKLCEDIVV